MKRAAFSERSLQMRCSWQWQSPRKFLDTRTRVEIVVLSAANVVVSPTLRRADLEGEVGKQVQRILER